MRHSAATLALAAGVPLKNVSDLLGHSSIRLTSDSYAHLTSAALVEHVDTLGRVLEGPK